MDYLVNLTALSTDPDFKYFARVALRLLLLSDIIGRIAAVKPALLAEWQLGFPLWSEFARTAFLDPPENFLESLPSFLQ